MLAEPTPAGSVGSPMRGITAGLIAVGVLWAADAFLNDGRYADVVLRAVRNVAASIGLPI